jgi:MOSC domain-containing protein YiiM
MHFESHDPRMTTPVLLSIQVGMPRVLGVEGATDPLDRPWTTAFAKEPVEGAVWLGREGLAGDGQADRRVHGGPEMALLGYSADHYPAWRSELDFPDLPWGAFGENFTIASLSEAEVCVGDTYAVGEARVQVSQPRQPCRNISRRWRRRDLTARVLATGRTGWYLRVLAEGAVERGLPVELLERPFPRWTIACTNAVLYSRGGDRRAAAELSACPLLSPPMSAKLAARAEIRARGRGLLER